jgi:hypothetical protein
MVEKRKQSPIEILFSRVIGIVVFLILLGILNLVAGTYIESTIFLQIVEFLNDSIGLLILITAFFLLGDLFGALPLPLSLPGPVFGAIGALFMVTFIIRLFLLVGEITGVRFFALFETFAFLIYPLVFIVALVAGYISLFTDTRMA